MNPAIVVMHVVKRNRGFMVLQLLTVRVSQSGTPSSTPSAVIPSRVILGAEEVASWVNASGRCR
jgi:hypothetical protein